MQKEILYCIIGMSGSGKNSVCEKILEKTNLKPIISYTTRPRRVLEEDGKDYHFVDDAFMLDNPLIIEKRVYETANGKWYYATVNDGQLQKGDSIIIASPEQYLNIKRFFKDSKAIKVVPIYIYVDDGIRLQRLISREMLQEKPNYHEICRRYEADVSDFAVMSKERKFFNYSLSECVNEILVFMEEKKNEICE